MGFILSLSLSDYLIKREQKFHLNFQYVTKSTISGIWNLSHTKLVHGFLACVFCFYALTGNKNCVRNNKQRHRQASTKKNHVSLLLSRGNSLYRIAYRRGQCSAVRRQRGDIYTSQSFNSLNKIRTYMIRRDGIYFFISM